MAVVANILIFERLKEELRAGRSLSSAISEGFSRAWPSIRDSNFTTILTTLVLINFSTSIIKGFAVTLLIGVLISMFSAIMFTRTLLRLFSEQWFEKHRWLIGYKQKS
jgi:preprotein translocase subunit SecD